MSRTSFYFVSLCMLLIAGSAGMIAYLTFRWGLPESVIIALSLMLVMVLGHTSSQRARDRAALDLKFADLSRVAAEMMRQSDELGRRLDRIEAGVLDKAKAVAAPISAEVEQLGSIVQQFAQTLQAHEQAIEEATHLAIQQKPLVLPTPVAAEPLRPAASLVAATQARPARPATGADIHGPLGHMDLPDIAAILRGAINDNRADLYLQPIVTLPQRKVRYYEALTRLRGVDGTVYAPADYLGPAETAGLMPQIDNLLLFRAVQVVRRLMGRNRDAGIFCNLSAQSLSDPGFAQNLLGYMEANKALAGAIVFELSQKAVRELPPLEVDTMTTLASMGFRFSMDQVADLRIEPRALADQGFRFVKVRADLLLYRANEAGAVIHPADLADLLARHGIDLIVEHVETEGAVVDLLDFDVKFGQGFLFAPPRPVRADVMGASSPVEDEAPPPVRAAAPKPAAPARPAAAPAAPVAQAPAPPPPQPQSVGEAVLLAAQKKPGLGLAAGLRSLVRNSPAT